MGIISWIIFGLIAGALAKFIMPGDDQGRFIVTTLIGIVCVVVGGFIGSALGMGTVTGLDIRSFIVVIGGAIILLFAYRRIKS